MYAKQPDLLPTKLKVECLGQLDQWLYSHGCSTHLGIILSSSIVEEHLPASIVLSALKQLDDIFYAWKAIVQSSWD